MKNIYQPQVFFSFILFCCFGQFLFAQEICDNGIDDDGDDLIDCEDPDCQPEIITVTSSLPTSPDCNDGEVIIMADGQNLEYSINGSLGPFQASNVFSNLSRYADEDQ